MTHDATCIHTSHRSAGICMSQFYHSVIRYWCLSLSHLNTHKIDQLHHQALGMESQLPGGITKSHYSHYNIHEDDIFKIPHKRNARARLGVISISRIPTCAWIPYQEKKATSCGMWQHSTHNGIGFWGRAYQNMNFLQIVKNIDAHIKSHDLFKAKAPNLLHEILTHNAWW